MNHTHPLIQSLLLLSLWLLPFLGNARECYVSIDGKADAEGTIEDPYPSLKIALSQLPRGEANSIIIRGGRYEFEKQLRVDSWLDLEIKAYPGEEVIFSGGRELPLSSMRKLRDTDAPNLFPKENRPYIHWIDLKELGIEDFGYIWPVGSSSPTALSPMEFIMDGQVGQLARWPNDSMMAITGLAEPKHSPKGANDFHIKVGRFKYPENPDFPCNGNEDAWVFGYFHYGFASDLLKVAEWDFENKEIQTFHGHSYGFAAGYRWNRFGVLNLPQALDQEGEYYIDRESGILYFYTKKTAKRLEVSMSERPILEINGGNGLLISGIRFQSSRSVGISMSEVNDSRIEHCSFWNMGFAAILMDEKPPSASMEFESYPLGQNTIREKRTCQNITISHCEMAYLGAGGIYLNGGNRKTLEKGGHVVEHCHIHHFNRWDKHYQPGISIQGVGHRIAHCHIHHGSNQAILLKGNDHIIEYNDIHDVCLEVHDGAALYYGRDPSERGHIVRHNYFHHIGGDKALQTSAIYHDDGACGMEVHGNIFLDAGQIAVFIGGGQDIHYHNNLFVRCMVALHVDDRMGNFAQHHLEEDGIIPQRLADIHFDQPPYSVRYPNLAQYWDNDPRKPQRIVWEKNIIVEAGKLSDTGLELLDWKTDNITISGMPREWEDEWEKRDFIPRVEYLPKPEGWVELEVE